MSLLQHWRDTWRGVASDAAFVARLLPWLRLSWASGAALMLVVVTSALARLPLPLLTGYVIDTVLPARSTRSLWIVGGLLLGVAIVSMAVHLLKGRILAKLRERMARNLQRDCLRSVLDRPAPLVLSQPIGHLVSRLIIDSRGLYTILSDQTLMLTVDIFTVLLGLVFMAWLHVKTALLCLALLPAYVCSSLVFGARRRDAAEALQEEQAAMHAGLQQALAGLWAVQTYGRERYELRWHVTRFNQVSRRRVMLNDLTYASTGLVGALGTLIPVTVLLYGGSEVIAGRLSVGGMVALTAYMNFVLGPIGRFSNVQAQVREACAGVARTLELVEALDTPESERGSRQGPLSVSSLRGDIEFKNVAFSHGDGPRVLSSVTFVARQGQVTSLVGYGGAGKSTIIHLLRKMYLPEAGQILLGGRNIADLPAKTVRKALAVVDQDPIILEGTVYDNIAYGSADATVDDVRRAARAADCDGFIERLPDGLNTPLGLGVTLSGSQRQRLCIARALVKNAPVLVLDEATAFVDTESTHAIYDVLRRERPELTVLVIARTLTTVMSADRILVLDGGRITAEGSHHTLMADSSVYRDLFERQVKLCHSGYAAAESVTTS